MIRRSQILMNLGTSAPERASGLHMLRQEGEGLLERQGLGSGDKGAGHQRGG